MRVSFRLNGEMHAEMLLGQHVTANPVIGTHFSRLSPGDEIFVNWQNSAGEFGQTSVVKE